MLVLDASMALAWCFEDESDPLPVEVLRGLPAAGAWVPAIWPIEVANGVIVGERRQRLSQAQISRFFAVLARLPITIDTEQAAERAFGPISGLAREHGLSVYDACYLDLALRRTLPLATLDRRLRDAAVRAGALVVEIGQDISAS